MNVNLPYNIGDTLYWADVRAEGDGPPLTEIKAKPGGIEAIKITPGGPIIVSDDTDCVPGTQYACLEYDDCRRWISQEHKNPILLKPNTRIKAVYVDMSRNRWVIDLNTCLDDIERYVKNPMSTEPDDNGVIAICVQNAQTAGYPMTSVLQDARGNSVGAVFGPYLLMKLSEPDESGLRYLTDADETLTRWVYDENHKPEEPAEYDPAYWAACTAMTVDDLCSYLKSKFPDDARMHICGTHEFWVHYAPNNKAVCLDCESLASLEEYADKEAKPVYGTAKR